jgi:hypothetical protein
MRDGENADWKAIVGIACDADTKLAGCSKPGQRMRFIYTDSYRRACACGYHGNEDDWESFVRVRAAAAYKKDGPRLSRITARALTANPVPTVPRED